MQGNSVVKSFLFANVPLSVVHFILFIIFGGFLGRPGIDLAAALGVLAERGLNLTAISAQPVPETTGQMAAVIYQSLALSYAKTVKEIEELTGKHYEAINIVGGGSKAKYLNELTARATGRKVIAGPGEGTAIGNLMAQMITDGVFRDLKDARACVTVSFDITEEEAC